jgi:hypothetical protein
VRAYSKEAKVADDDDITRMIKGREVQDLCPQCGCKGLKYSNFLGSLGIVLHGEKYLGQCKRHWDKEPSKWGFVITDDGVRYNFVASVEKQEENHWSEKGTWVRV